MQIESSSPSPWSLSQLRLELQRANGVQLAARISETVAGWCCAWNVTEEEAELLKIAVAQEHRRKGIASTLLEKLETQLEGRGTRSIFLEVRSQNSIALKFYLKSGYFQVGLRKRYYSSPEDDAIVLKKELFQQ